jgi:hypothetical protein
MYHSALTLSHAFMSAGTTSDAFLRQNLDFLSRANNWSKFTATSALGVINKGSLSRGRTLLGPYLPSASAGAGPSQQGKEFSEGGALFAVGLVNAGRGGEECDWLVGQMKAAEDEVVKHGAALGLGVAGMASGSEGPSHLFLFNRCQVSLADATSSHLLRRDLRHPPRDALPRLGCCRRGLGLRDGPRYARLGLGKVL